ncbi:Ammonium transporter Rh type B-B [Folsomia candida]|uniref:Ammonium transporter Rh type B-B n=1 Tax=Folsomia candida TaxID=158441 RepID=A0A226ETK8_FOLCA|nr:Ammonium transporter Rh type B-B [Folsomia candida]
MNLDRAKFGLILLCLEVLIVLLFTIFVGYDLQADGSHEKHHVNPSQGGLRPQANTIVKYDSMYQDVHVMIFVGFGFLMTFLKRYGYSAVGLTMLLSAVAIQWGILCRGIFHHDDHGMINIEITSLINADFAAGAVLISLGGILGVSSPFQLTVMVLIEVFLYSLNEYIGAEIFKAIDVGGSMFIHAFGAYFGLALSRMMKPTKDINSTNEAATKTSDLFAMIGTIFLWIYWPSFNGALASGDDQHRAVINTLLSLSASLLMTFVWSGILSHENKLDMVHIQNATLAGGVAVGAPFLKSKLGLHDTCGVHNLHGMPGVIGGIAGTIMAAMANEQVYGNSLYQQYPARAPVQNSSEFSEIVNEFADVEPGEGRTAASQAIYQLATLGVTLAIAIVGGSLTGLILRAPVFDNVPLDQHFDDVYFWECPEDEEKTKLMEANKNKGLDNRTFDFELGADSDTKNVASQAL